MFPPGLRQRRAGVWPKRRWAGRYLAYRRASEQHRVYRSAAHPQREEGRMRLCGQRLASVLMTLSLLFLVLVPVWAADPETDKLLRQPSGKDWITNGGDLNN